MDIRSSINKLPFIGGLTESIFGSPEEEEMQKQMMRAANAYRQYRPQIMETGMNAFNNQAAAFAPGNQMIADMYGPQYQTDMSKLVQNPFPADMQKGMYDEAFGKKKPAPYIQPKPTTR